MSSEHFLIGKDASLEASISTMQARLVALGFALEETAWLNPIKGAWSVHLRDRDCPLLYTNGKGGSELAARASALGEFFERLSCHYFWTHYYLGAARANAAYVHFPQERWFPLPANDRWPKGLLTPQLQAFYNPEGSVPANALVDHNSSNPGRGICALPFTRQRDGEVVWFPVNIIGNLYVSNGMAAGNSRAEARAQALSEIIERYVKFRVIAEGLCLPEIPAEVLARTPAIQAGIAALQAAGFGVLVRDASLGGIYPVVNVTLLNPRDQGCFASFGAHPRFEVALERTLTELLQGRGLQAMDGFPEPGFEQGEIASSTNLEIHFVDSSGVMPWRFLADTPDFPFADWDFTSRKNQTLCDHDWLLELIQSEGFEVYVADYDQLGVYACRVLVPGMSEIYDVADLEWENNSQGNLVRADILNLPQLDEEGCAALLETLNTLNLADERPVAHLIGLAPDPGTLWEELRVGELKTWLALAIGDEEAILDGCEWARQFGQLDEARKRVYRCIEALLGLEDANPYETALRALYGDTTLQQALDLLDGETRFFKLPAPGLTLEGCTLHQALLQAYGKAHGGFVHNQQQ